MNKRREEEKKTKMLLVGSRCRCKILMPSGIVKWINKYNGRLKPGATFEAQKTKDDINDYSICHTGTHIWVLGPSIVRSHWLLTLLSLLNQTLLILTPCSTSLQIWNHSMAMENFTQNIQNDSVQLRKPLFLSHVMYYSESSESSSILEAVSTYSTNAPKRQAYLCSKH